MTIKVQRTGSDEYGRHIRALFCGPAGAGKTLISSTFPDPFYSSAEQGLMSVADRNIPFTQITASTQFRETIAILKKAPNEREDILGTPVETFVVDTLDWIQKIFIQERRKLTGKETMQRDDWGWIGELWRPMLRAMVNLDMNVVFTCHLVEISDEDGPTRYKPSLQGAIGNEIADYVDIAVPIRTSSTKEIVDGEIVIKEHRYLQTYKDSMYEWIKDRSGKLPREFPVNFTDDFARMHELVYAGVGELPDSKEIALAELPRPAAVPQPQAPEPAAKPEPAKAAKKATKKAAAKPDPKIPAPKTAEEVEAELKAKVAEKEAKVEAPKPEPAPEPEEKAEAVVVPEEATPEVADSDASPVVDVNAATEETAPSVDVEQLVDAATSGEASTTTEEETTKVPPTPAPADDESGPWACKKCGDEFDDYDQYELSTIMKREAQCGPCYRGEK